MAEKPGSEEPTTRLTAPITYLLVELRQATFGHVVLWQDGGVI
jgi:hypothetical protein